MKDELVIAQSVLLQFAVILGYTPEAEDYCPWYKRRVIRKLCYFILEKLGKLEEYRAILRRGTYFIREWKEKYGAV